jgi:hypothetical protein
MCQASFSFELVDNANTMTYPLLTMIPFSIFDFYEASIFFFLQSLAQWYVSL